MPWVRHDHRYGAENQRPASSYSATLPQGPESRVKMGMGASIKTRPLSSCDAFSSSPFDELDHGFRADPWVGPRLPDEDEIPMGQ